MNIRRYEPRDRAAVREICCETADVAFPDREILADLLTRYYTDIDPTVTLVAVIGGPRSVVAADATERVPPDEVVGYLTGCLDTRRYLRVMAMRIVPAALLKALVRGSCRQLRQFLIMPKSDFRRTKILSDYPAHLHVNFRKHYRGQGGGGALMEQFLRQATEAGIPGVHAGVSESNERGRQFFEKHGFVPLGREPRPGGAFTILYGRKVFR